MPLLNIDFTGTCIHFLLLDNPGIGLPVPYRVVFPAIENVTIDGFPFQLQPMLQIGDADPIPLQGVRLFIQPEAGIEPPPTLTASCVPHLQTIWPEMVLNVPAVTANAPATGAYFDAFNGQVNGRDVEGAACARLTLNLTTPGTILVLESNLGIETLPIDLPNTIRITNHPTPPVEQGNQRQQEAALQLNFAIATVFPPPPLPSIAEQLKAIVECLDKHPADAGPGCSNSQYP